MGRELRLYGGGVAIVDEEDFEELGRYEWRLDPNGYVYRMAQDGATGRWSQVRMHRQIANPGPGLVVDHLNWCRHDNRRENLRVCTRAENSSRQKPWRDRRTGSGKAPSSDIVGTIEAAAILGLTRVTVARLCEKGHAPGAKMIAGRWFIPAEAVAVLMRARPKPGRPRPKQDEEEGWNLGG